MQYDPQTMQELLRIISSPAGQQLIAMLQKNGGDDLQNAIQQAANGNFSDARKTVSSLLNDPDARKLLEQLGR